MITEEINRDLSRIIFEQPLNERCRLFLRLSHLFEQFDYHTQMEDYWNSRAALQALLDIAKILIRADIKIDLLKEMEKYISFLSRISDLPNIDKEKLRKKFKEIDRCQHALKDCDGPLGLQLRKDDLLNSFFHRKDIPGGGFAFDLPLLHLWLNQDYEKRLRQFKNWRQEIEPVYLSVSLLLELIRNSTEIQDRVALDGFYQQDLLSGSSVQMVQVFLNGKYQDIFAEISGGKHRLNIRFMRHSSSNFPCQINEDIEFGLNVCII